jgi:cobalt-zinc-cadmium efflux system membrane fusion protein
LVSFAKAKHKNRKTYIIFVLLIVYCLLPIQQSIAHGDDDHGAKKSGNNFSNSFNVPKETQFLFDVFTEKVQSGSFTESTKLFGTIIPSSNGQHYLPHRKTEKLFRSMFA